MKIVSNLPRNFRNMPKIAFAASEIAKYRRLASLHAYVYPALSPVKRRWGTSVRPSNGLRPNLTNQWVCDSTQHVDTTQLTETNYVDLCRYCSLSDRVWTANSRQWYRYMYEYTPLFYLWEGAISRVQRTHERFFTRKISKTK